MNKTQRDKFVERIDKLLPSELDMYDILNLLEVKAVQLEATTLEFHSINGFGTMFHIRMDVKLAR